MNFKWTPSKIFIELASAAVVAAGLWAVVGLIDLAVS